MNKLLVFAEYYYPGYKAGGPIQSLLNITECIREDFTISVYTSSYDLTAAAPYDQVTPNEWNNIVVRGNEYSIFYKAGRGLQIRSLIRAVRKTDVIYLNGIFSSSFFLLPVLVNFFLKKKMIISPRGMLQAGALNVKSKKKRIYLFLLKKSGLLNNAKWHATDPVEKEDIASVFAKNNGIVVLPNLPRKPLPVIATPQKEAGKLNLVYLSLITAKKNLDLLLAAVAEMDNVYLNVYGPVKDVKYWEKKCLPIISRHPDKITYKGDLQPEMVQQTIAAYDALALLSSGENFGHALYECLSVGRPVITSPFTPWTDLEIKKAGFNTEINNVSTVIATLERMRLMDQTTYKLFCIQAHHEACEYYFGTDFKAGYKKLFTS